MCEGVEDFSVDKEIDLTQMPSDGILERVLEELKDVKIGHYMLIHINDYSQIAEIARAVVTKKATVDNVLKRGSNRWSVMIKNDVPVAQTG